MERIIFMILLALVALLTGGGLYWHVENNYWYGVDVFTIIVSLMAGFRLFGDADLRGYINTGIATLLVVTPLIVTMGYIFHILPYWLFADTYTITVSILSILYFAFAEKV